MRVKSIQACVLRCRISTDLQQATCDLEQQINCLNLKNYQLAVEQAKNRPVPDHGIFSRQIFFLAQVGKETHRCLLPESCNKSRLAE